MFELILKILVTMLSVTGLLILGGLLRRSHVLKHRHDRPLLKLIIRGLLPALIFGLIAGNKSLRDPVRALTPPLMGFGLIVFGFAVAAMAVRMLRRVHPMSLPAQRTFIFTVGVQNYGYIAAPIAVVLYGMDSLAVLYLHNVGVDLAYWTIGVLIMTGHFSRSTLLRAINPPSVAIVIALITNWTDLADHIPVDVTDAMTFVGKISIPLGLILIGATISDHLREANLRGSFKMVAIAAALRLVLIPTCIVFIAWLLPVAIELKQIMIVQAAMPSGVFAIVMARHYQGDTPTAMRIILATNVMCLFTMPIWLPIGLAIIGVKM